MSLFFNRRSAAWRKSRAVATRVPGAAHRWIAPPSCVGAGGRRGVVSKVEPLEVVVVVFVEAPARIGPAPCVRFAPRSTKRGWDGDEVAVPALLMVNLHMGSHLIFNVC